VTPRGVRKCFPTIAARFSAGVNSGDIVTQYLGIDWLAMCLTFSAIYLLGNKSRKGFVVMMLGNLCWAAIGVWAHSYAMVIANLGFFSMNVRAFRKWAPAESTGA
jgi:hypothetical protein